MKNHHFADCQECCMETTKGNVRTQNFAGVKFVLYILDWIASKFIISLSPQQITSKKNNDILQCLHSLFLRAFLHWYPIVHFAIGMNCHVFVYIQLLHCFSINLHTNQRLGRRNVRLSTDIIIGVLLWP